MKNEHVSRATYSVCEEFQDKNIIEIILIVNDLGDTTRRQMKDKTLRDINIQLDTRYNINHFNNWLAERVATPQRVKSLIRLWIMQYLFGDDIAEMLKETY